MATIDEILAVAAANRRTATVKVLFNDELIEAHAAKEEALAAEFARFSGDITKPEHVRELAAEVEALEDEMESDAVPFTFAALSFAEWTALIAKHPPTKAQRAANALADVNMDTFQPAALAASCIEPEMTAEQAGALRDALRFDQFVQLWATCHAVNRGGDAAPKSKLAGLILRRNGASGTTAVSTASLGASSSDES